MTGPQPEVMGALPRCGQQGCTGHLGKFPDCLTEALWEISMYEGESTGSTEAYGHFTLLDFQVPTRHSIGYDLGVPEEQQGPIVEIPAGWYMVQATESGAVYHLEYESEQVARVAYDELDQEYSAWLDINEPDISPNAGSSE